MKAKIFKGTLPLFLGLLIINLDCFAQDVIVTVKTNPDISIKTKGLNTDVQADMDELARTLNNSLKSLGDNLTLSINNIAPKLKLELRDLQMELNKNPDVHLNLQNIAANGNMNFEDEGDDDATITDGRHSVKTKNLSKSYPIDGNDKIRLSNQYGKISVTTWDKREVKVDIQIVAQANDETEAQKLMDGVQISDSKNGDLVSFKTELAHNNGSWSLFGRNKLRKLTINYTVYMPAKTDLNVEDSYGSIELPNLSGHIKITSSYGSVSAENLTNPANEIDGSYGSVSVNSLNGAHLQFSYGSVNIEECNNLKADLSYGTFKLGKLKGIAELDLSYVGGFKIDELANSFKKVNINASYSGVSIGVPSGNNFDFDITTTYGGFNYSADKVIVTSKTPADGSRHVSSTKNYKGHFGKEGAESQVNIRSTYGGVNFD